MTMELTISNFIRVKDARMTIGDGITLVSGDNESGKSTLLRAAAACATGQVIPIMLPSGKEAITKGGSKAMVHAGQKKGWAQLESNGETVQLLWPVNATKGKPPIFTTALSTGLMEWMGLLPDGRRKLLTNAMTKGGLSVEPTFEDLKNSMSVAGVGDQSYVQYVWNLIQGGGWDVASQQIASKWSEVTGMWRAATGESYGQEKAKEWVPNGWVPELATRSEQDLRQAIIDASTALEEGIARRAVGGVNIEILRAEADKPMIDLAADKAKLVALTNQLDQLKSMTDPESAEVGSIKKRLLEINDTLSVINRKVAKLDESRTVMPIIPKPPGESNKNATCPACGVGLHASIKAGLPLIEPETKTTPEIMRQSEKAINDAKAQAKQCQEINLRIDQEKKELAEKLGHCFTKQKELTVQRDGLIRNARKEVQDQIQRVSTEIAELNALISSTQKVNQSIQAAAVQLKQIDAQCVGGGNTVTDETIAQLRAAVDYHTLCFDVSKVKISADNAATRAERLAIVKKILAQDGLRASKLQAALDHVTKMITQVCTAADWSTITMDTDLSLYMGGQPYVMLSKSAQFRCQTVMQMAMAKLDGSELLLIDGADILGSWGRLGLIKMLRRMGIRALVAMTAKRDYAETVSKMFDATFWVENGVVTAISDETFGESEPTSTPEETKQKGPQEDPKLIEFKTRLANHDWFYTFSDDGRAYRKGKEAEQQLISIAKTSGDSFKRAMNEQWQKQCVDSSIVYQPYFPEC